MKKTPFTIFKDITFIKPLTIYSPNSFYIFFSSQYIINSENHITVELVDDIKARLKCS